MPGKVGQLRPSHSQLTGTFNTSASLTEHQHASCRRLVHASQQHRHCGILRTPRLQGRGGWFAVHATTKEHEDAPGSSRSNTRTSTTTSSSATPAADQYRPAAADNTEPNGSSKQLAGDLAQLNSLIRRSSGASGPSAKSTTPASSSDRDADSDSSDSDEELLVIRGENEGFVVKYGDEELKLGSKQEVLLLVLAADAAAFLVRQAAWMIPVVLLANPLAYDFEAHISWDWAAVQVGAAAGVPVLLLLALQELWPWWQPSQPQEVTRQPQLLNAALEHPLRQEEDLDDVSSRRPLGEPGWPALQQGLDAYQRANFSLKHAELKIQPTAYQAWVVVQEWLKPSLAPLAFKGLLLSSIAAYLLDILVTQGWDRSGPFFWLRLLGITSPAIALALAVLPATLALIPTHTRFRFAQTNVFRIFTRSSLLQMEMLGQLAPGMWLSRYSLEGTSPLPDESGKAPMVYRQNISSTAGISSRVVGMALQRAAAQSSGHQAQDSQQESASSSSTTTTSQSSSGNSSTTTRTSSSACQPQGGVPSTPFSSSAAVLNEVQTRYQLLLQGLNGLDGRLADLAATQVEQLLASRPPPGQAAEGNKQDGSSKEDANRTEISSSGSSSSSSSSGSSTTSSSSSLKEATPSAHGVGKQQQQQPSGVRQQGGGGSNTGDSSSSGDSKAAGALAAEAAPDSSTSSSSSGSQGLTPQPSTISAAVRDSAQTAVWEAACQVLDKDAAATYQVIMLDRSALWGEDAPAVVGDKDTALGLQQTLHSSSSSSKDAAGQPTHTAAAEPAAVPAAEVKVTGAAGSGEDLLQPAADRQPPGQQQQQEQQPMQQQQEPSDSDESDEEEEGESRKGTISAEAAAAFLNMKGSMDGWLLEGRNKDINLSQQDLEGAMATEVSVSEMARVSTAADAALASWLVLVAVLGDFMTCSSYAASGGNLVAAFAAVSTAQLGGVLLRYLGYQRWRAGLPFDLADDSSNDSDDEE